MVCSTYDDDENSGLSFGQVLKYGRVKPVNGTQSSPWTCLVLFNFIQ
jgi:hypothetical protein